MKVRLSDSSMRLRITRQEAAQLSKGESVSCLCAFDAIHQWELQLSTWLLEVPGYDLEKKKWSIQVPASTIEQADANAPWEAWWKLDSGFEISLEVDLAEFKQSSK